MEMRDIIDNLLKEDVVTMSDEEIIIERKDLFSAGKNVGELVHTDTGEIWVTPNDPYVGSFHVRTEEDGIELCRYYIYTVVPTLDKLQHWVVR